MSAAPGDAFTVGMPRDYRLYGAHPAALPTSQWAEPILAGEIGFARGLRPFADIVPFLVAARRRFDRAADVSAYLLDQSLQVGR
jgi:hypothetical protein